MVRSGFVMRGGMVMRMCCMYVVKGMDDKEKCVVRRN